mgnify:CR=1 FL=1
MKKQTTFRKTIEKVWKNRAAIVIAIAATVFMCGLTALEFVALRMEWNLPVLAYVILTAIFLRNTEVMR